MARKPNYSFERQERERADAKKAEAKAAAKAAKKSPLTDAQKQAALVGAYASFTMCALAVLAGLALIVVK